MWNIPNSLTFSRILMIPVFIFFFLLETSWARPVSGIIFIFAALTDWFDGYLARKFDQQSALGAFLDPVADKLMVSTALVLLVAEYPENLIMMLSAVVIIGREITISALREWMAELGKRGKVAVSMIGKFKTFAQMFALIFLIYRNDMFNLPVFSIGLALLIISAILTIISMFIYLKAAWQVIKEDAN